MLSNRKNHSAFILSDYRTELMGVATLMIVFFHLTFRIEHNALWYLSTHAMIGVEMFFLLSGMGLCWSISQDKNLCHFYFKRVIRIFPTYGLVILSCLIVTRTFSWKAFLLEWSTVGYWTGSNYYDWYIPNQMLLYFIFPLLYVCVNRRWRASFIILAIGSVALCLVNKNIDFMAFCRYPVFITGVFLGTAMLKNRMPSAWERVSVILFLIAFVFSFCVHLFFTNQQLIDNGWLFKPQMLMVVGLCVLLSKALAKCNFCCKILKLIGAMSLDVYLLHNRFIDLAEYISARCGGGGKYALGLLLLFVSFFVAYGLHIVMGKLSSVLLVKFCNNIRC